MINKGREEGSESKRGDAARDERKAARRRGGKKLMSNSRRRCAPDRAPIRSTFTMDGR